jgi:hypothetical protein
MTMKHLATPASKILSLKSALRATTVLVMFGGSVPVFAQDCVAVNGVLPEDCRLPNGDVVVTVPAQPNTEREALPVLTEDGFQISVDGDPVAEDGTILRNTKPVEATIRKQDIALAEADVAIKFDGLDIRPRLDVETVGKKKEYEAGNAITFRNYMNYPSFVTRGEVRIIETGRRAGAETVAVLPLGPNGEVTGRVPAGEDLIYVYRVYDARGRYDETVPVSLKSKSRRGLEDGVEQGTDSTAVRRIPVFGGAVTVSGTNVRDGSRVTTLGEIVRPDDNGNFVLQRILPTGDHTVGVSVDGEATLARDIEVPAHDLFYTGLVDITLRKNLRDDLEQATNGNDYDDTIARGRVAFYLKGKIKGEYLITAAADTGDEELKNLLRNFDEKNPRSLLDRIDPNEYYPVYGDDSTSEIDAPTSGKLYVKVEKNDSYAVWGNFKSSVKGTEYLRSERTLYGAQLVYRSPQQTSEGEPKVEFQAYGAQPDTLPQRDVFRGTGGSSYFLKFQDITRGSETLLIETVNPTTGQVISRRTLIYGQDYEINYIQGLILLKEPLSSSGSGTGLITSNPNGDDETYLVANYDHTPTAGSFDTFSYGARVQTWVTDKLRFGATLGRENLGTADQEFYGVDLLYQHSDRTYLEFEVAETDGPGIGTDTSFDGGITLNTEAGVAGSGRAVRLKGQVDLKDLGYSIDGVIGGYFEDREAGFSTLSYRSQNDERLWGVYFEGEPTDRWRLRGYYDDYEDSAGKFLKEGGVEVGYKVSDVITLDFGAEHIDQNIPGDPTKSGRRTDLAARVTYAPNEDFSVYGFLQGTVDHSGGISRNNRIGVGAKYKVNQQWTVSGEVSDGSMGVGARFLANYDRDENSSYYFGYTLDPERTFGNVALTGSDRGSFVVGARRKINESLSVFGENTYDIFGVHKSLTSAYGVDYELDDFWTFTAGLEVGRVTDPRSAVVSDFDRRAISLGAFYKDEQLSFRSRLEFRNDQGTIQGLNRDANTVAGEFVARYKINDNARWLFSMEGVKSTNASASIPDAKYFETVVGYALRPVDNDRLNILAKYTFLYDMTERVASTPSTGANFLNSPRQRAHVFSVDASYDLDEHWTLGAKVGARYSDQDSGTGGFVSNNATLGVLNLRYHSVHKWDALVEVRQLKAQDLGSDTGFLAAAYRHVGNNFKVGIGYNFGQFSDDLTDVTYNDSGVFLNLVGKF